MEEAEWPADASTLIYIAKADAFDDAADCATRLLVPPSAWREAVEQGEQIGAQEVPRIRDAVESGFLHLVELGRDEEALAGTIADEHRLGLGESEVLALGRALGTVVVDEGRATRVARALGIRPISTLFLPLVGRSRGKLESTDAIALLRRLAVVTGARAETVFVIEEALRKEPQ